jgi:hypothetical protein
MWDVLSAKITVPSWRQSRPAEGRLLFRDLNESLWERADVSGPIVFLCECPDELCTETVLLSAAEYAAIRKEQDTFVVCAWHSLSPDEEIVRQAADFSVIRARTSPVA